MEVPRGAGSVVECLCRHVASAVQRRLTAVEEEALVVADELSGVTALPARLTKEE